MKHKTKKNVIIKESQLHVIKEFENNKVLHDEFENKVRSYMEQLFSNPCKPKCPDFFSTHDIEEKDLLDKMSDLGLIKKTEKFSEPAKPSGKKHSVHSVKYTFPAQNFEDKIDKLYDTFFNYKGERMLKETDCGGAMGDGGFISSPSENGATNAEGVDGRYAVPFGGVVSRKIGRKSTSGNTETDFMEPALKRNLKKGISVNHTK